ncbi:MAG TPA: ATP-binding protein [Rhodocyclaceae bacterium]|nr:ATP-binding protein [Rhodocyclaceae bacterium]
MPGNGSHLGLLVGVFFLLAAGIGVLGWLAYAAEATHVRQREYDQLRAISHFKAAQVEAWLAERRWDAQLIFGSTYSRRDFALWLERRDSLSGARLEARLQSLLVNANYVGAELLDAAGGLRLVAGAGRRDWANLPADSLASPGSGAGPRLMDLRRQESGGPIRLAYLAPIASPEEGGRPLGFLWVGIDPERVLYPLIRSWPTPSPSAETLLVRREGNDALFLNDLRQLKGAALQYRIPMSREEIPAVQALLGREGIFEGRDYRGVAVLSFLQPIPGTPWQMVTKIDQDEVFQDIRQTARETLLAALVLLFFCAGLLWMSWLRQKLLARLHFRQELERVADLSPGVIHSFCLRPDGATAFPYASPAIRNVFGYGPEELAADAGPVLARVHPDDAGKMQDSVRESARELTPWHAEYRYDHPEKGEIWVEERSIPKRLPDGSVIWRGFLSDVTERKQAQQALEGYKDRLEAEVAARTADLTAANQELQAFTYAASHDLKAPLRGINGFVSLLERDYRDRLEGDGVRYLDHICSSAKRMTALIDDLLAYARVEQQTRELRSVNLGEAVHAVLAERQEEIRERGTELRVDLPPVRVRADPHGLAQVLRNLVGNALKYSAKAAHPAVEIGGAVEGGQCRLWVRDNGIGFDMAYRDEIFQIFRRLHGAQEFSGTGVGLALVKKAMDRMGGRVWAESTPGEGATFYLELACAPPPV